MGIEIWTDFDLSGVRFIIPAGVMKDIGMAYRKYRHNVIMTKRQLHDLSPMPPLKPETIARKSGMHGGGSHPGSAAIKAQRPATAVQLELVRRGFITEKRLGKSLTRVVSRYPDVPLVDTGNMTSERALDITATDGSLELRQGVSRAEIATYHQQGSKTLPQRVHISWNDQFVGTHILPIISAWLERELNRSNWKRIA
jgi:hypothetical protein